MESRKVNHKLNQEERKKCNRQTNSTAKFIKKKITPTDRRRKPLLFKLPKNKMDDDCDVHERE